MAEGTVPIGGNGLLGTLGPATLKIIAPLLQRVQLGLRAVVYDTDKPISNVYFPVDGVISLVAKTESGPAIEVATIGNEGMAGLPLFLGTDRAPGSCFSQVPGQAMQMSAANFRSVCEKSEEFNVLLRLYTQALMVQISQSTACNRAHSIRQRCARWLLLTQDRVRKDEFLLTQEFLGQMLGVRRATVNVIAGELQRQKIIRYSRGRMSILNRRRLEEVSCICYAIIRREYDRLLNSDAAPSLKLASARGRRRRGSQVHAAD